MGRLATASPEGDPHVVPICYVLLDNTLYSPLDEKPKRVDPHRLKRIKNLLANPRASVVVDHYHEDWRDLGYVLLHGSVRLIEAGPEHARAIGALRRKYAQYHSMVLEQHSMVALDVARVSTWGLIP